MNLFVRSGGNELYYHSNSSIYKYTMTTPYDFSTASLTQTSVDWDHLSTQSIDVNSLYFNALGTKVYGLHKTGSTNMYITSNTLSTAWDLSTISAGSDLFSGQTYPYGGTFQYNIYGLKFNQAGTQFHYIRNAVDNDGVSYNDLIVCSMTTAWDITTSSIASVTNIAYTSGGAGTSFECKGYTELSNGELIICRGSYLVELLNLSDTVPQSVRNSDIVSGFQITEDESMLWTLNSCHNVNSFHTNYTSAIDNTPPTMPGSFTATDNGSYITLSWSPSTDNFLVESYYIDKRVDSGSWSTLSPVGYPSTSHDDYVLPGYTYEYRMRAKDTSDNYSGFTSVETVVK